MTGGYFREGLLAKAESTIVLKWTDQKRDLSFCCSAALRQMVKFQETQTKITVFLTLYLLLYLVTLSFMNTGGKKILNLS